MTADGPRYYCLAERPRYNKRTTIGSTGTHGAGDTSIAIIRNGENVKLTSGLIGIGETNYTVTGFDEVTGTVQIDPGLAIDVNGKKVDRLYQYYAYPPGAIGGVALEPVGGTSYVFAVAEKAFDPAKISGLVFDNGGTVLSEYVPSSSEVTWMENNTGVTYSSGWTLLDWLWSALTDQADPEGSLRAKPIMPTRAGVQQLHLPGHSLVRSHQFQGETDPSWPQVRDVVRADYRKIRQLARSLQRGRPDEATLHRKFLETRRRKLSKVNAVDYRKLVPPDLPDESPVAPTTTITDDFNRSNLGSDWTKVDGDWQIDNNEVDFPGTGASSYPSALRYDGQNLSSDDHYTQVDFTDTPGATRNAFISAVARFNPNSTAGDEDGYDAQWEADDDGERRLRKFIGGTSTTLATDQPSATMPVTCRCVADGSTIRGVYNGTEVFTVTDTAITGHLNVGIFAHSADAASGDNFEAADLVSAIAIPSARMAARPSAARAKAAAAIQGNQRLTAAPSAAELSSRVAIGATIRGRSRLATVRAGTAVTIDAIIQSQTQQPAGEGLIAAAITGRGRLVSSLAEAEAAMGVAVSASSMRLRTVASFRGDIVLGVVLSIDETTGLEYVAPLRRLEYVAPLRRLEYQPRDQR